MSAILRQDNEMAMLLAQECVARWPRLSGHSDDELTLNKVIRDVMTVALRNGMWDVVEVFGGCFMISDELFAMKWFPYSLLQLLSTSTDVKKNDLICQFFDFLLNSKQFVKERLHYCNLMLQWPAKALNNLEDTLRVSMLVPDVDGFLCHFIACVQYGLVPKVTQLAKKQKPSPPKVQLAHSCLKIFGHKKFKFRAVRSSLISYYRQRAAYSIDLNDYILGQRCVAVSRVEGWSCLHEAAARGWIRVIACLLKLLPSDALNHVDSLGRTALSVASGCLQVGAVRELIKETGMIYVEKSSPLTLCVVRILLSLSKPSQCSKLVLSYLKYPERFATTTDCILYNNSTRSSADIRRLLVFAALWKQYHPLLNGLPVSGCYELQSQDNDVAVDIATILAEQISQGSHLSQQEIDLIAITAAVSSSRSLVSLLATLASAEQLRQKFRWSVGLQDVLDAFSLPRCSSTRHNLSVTVELGAVDLACIYSPGRVNRNQKQEIQAINGGYCAMSLFKCGCTMVNPWLAAQKFHWDVVKHCLKIYPCHWPDSNHKSDWKEPTLLAWWHTAVLSVIEGEVPVVSSILDTGSPDVLFYGKDDECASESLLHVAVKKRQYEVVRVLLRHGCDPLVKIPLSPIVGKKLRQLGVKQAIATSPFHFAIQFGDVRMVTALLSHMGDNFKTFKAAEEVSGIPTWAIIEMATSSGNKMVVELLRRKIKLASLASSQERVHLQCQLNDLQTVSGMFDDQCFGWFSPLMELNAAENTDKDKYHEISIYQPYFRLSRCNISLISLMGYACQFNQLQVLEAIRCVMSNLEFGQNITSLLGVVCKYGHNEILEYILRCWKQIDGYNELVTNFIDKLDESGYSPLALAIFGGHYRCVKLLLEHGADVSWTDCRSAGSGVGLLHLSCISGSVEIVRLLLPHLPEPMKSLKDKVGLDSVQYASGYGHGSLLGLLYDKAPEDLLESDCHCIVNQEQQSFLCLAFGWFRSLMKRNAQQKRQLDVRKSTRHCFTISGKGYPQQPQSSDCPLAPVWERALDCCHYDIIEELYYNSFGQVVTLASQRKLVAVTRHNAVNGISCLLQYLSSREDTLLKCSFIGTEENLLRLYARFTREILSIPELALNLALNAAVRGQYSVAAYLIQDLGVPATNTSTDGCTLVDNAFAFGHRNEGALLLSLLLKVKSNDTTRFSSVLADFLPEVPLKMQLLMGLQCLHQQALSDAFSSKTHAHCTEISTLFLGCCWSDAELECLKRLEHGMATRRSFPFHVCNVTVDVDWQSFDSNADAICQSFSCSSVMSVELLVNTFVSSDFVLSHVIQDIYNNMFSQPRLCVIHFMANFCIGTPDDGNRHYIFDIEQTRCVKVDVEDSTVPPHSSVDLSANKDLKRLCSKTGQCIEQFVHQQVFVSLAIASLSQAPASVVSFVCSASGTGGLGGFYQYVADCLEIWNDIQSLIPRCKRNTRCQFGKLCAGVFVDYVDTVSVRYVPGLASIDCQALAHLIQPQSGRLVWPFDVCDGKLVCIPDQFSWTHALKKERVFFLRCASGIGKLHSAFVSNCVDIVIDWNSFKEQTRLVGGVDAVACGVDTVLSSIAAWYCNGQLEWSDVYTLIASRVLHDIMSVRIQSAAAVENVEVDLTFRGITVSLLVHKHGIEHVCENLDKRLCGNFTVLLPTATSCFTALLNPTSDKKFGMLVSQSLERLGKLLQAQFPRVTMSMPDEVAINAIARTSQFEHDNLGVPPADVFLALVDGRGHQQLRKLVCSAGLNLISDVGLGFEKLASVDGGPSFYTLRDHSYQFIPYVRVQFSSKLERRRCVFGTISQYQRFADLQLLLPNSFSQLSNLNRRMWWMPITEILQDSSLTIFLKELSSTEVCALLLYLQNANYSDCNGHHLSLATVLQSQLNRVVPQAKESSKAQFPGVFVLDDDRTAWSIREANALVTLCDGLSINVVPRVANTIEQTPENYCYSVTCDSKTLLHWSVVPHGFLQFTVFEEFENNSSLPAEICKVAKLCEIRLREILQNESFHIFIHSKSGLSKAMYNLMRPDFKLLCAMMEETFQEMFNNPLQRKLERAGLLNIEPRLIFGKKISGVDIVIEQSTEVNQPVQVYQNILIVRLSVVSIAGKHALRMQLPMPREFKEALQNLWLKFCQQELASLLKKDFMPRLLKWFQLSLGRQIPNTNVVINIAEMAERRFDCLLQSPEFVNIVTEGLFETLIDDMLIEDLIWLSTEGQWRILSVCNAVEMLLSCASRSRAAQYLTWCNQIKFVVSYSISDLPIVLLLPSGVLQFSLCMNRAAVYPSARSMAMQILRSAQTQQVPSSTIPYRMLRSSRASSHLSRIDFSQSTALFFSSVCQLTEFSIAVCSSSGHVILGPVEGIEVSVNVYKVKKSKTTVLDNSVSWTWRKGLVAAVWRPTMKGWHLIEIKLNGNHIKQSPCRFYVNDDQTRSGIQSRLGTGVRGVSAGSPMRCIATYDHMIQPYKTRFHFPVKSGRLQHLSAVNLLHQMRQKLCDYVCFSHGDLDVLVSLVGQKDRKSAVTQNLKLKVIWLATGVYYVIITPYIASSLKMMVALSRTQQPLSVYFADGGENWNRLSMGFVLPGNVCATRCCLRTTSKTEKATIPKLATLKSLSNSRQCSKRKARKSSSKTEKSVVKCRAGDTFECIIEAHDRYGNKHMTGGGINKVEIERGHQKFGTMRPSNIECEVTDLANGTYMIRGTPTSAGVKMVLINGSQVSGQTIQVVETCAYGPTSELVILSKLTQCFVNEQLQFFVNLRDQFGNEVKCSQKAHLVQAFIDGTSCLVQHVKEKGATYLCVSVSPESPGEHTLVMKVGDKHVRHSPFKFIVCNRNVFEKRKQLVEALNKCYSLVWRSNFRTLTIRREHLFEDAFAALNTLKGESLYTSLRIRFDLEIGHDGGGLKR